MGALKTLAQRLNKRADKINEEASLLATQVALVVVGSLAYDTPVDVSTALSNWQIGLGSPVHADRTAFYPGEKGSTYKISAQATVVAARTVLANKRPGQPVYISNLLPYIRKLNAGYSKQSAGAFVETAVLRGHEYLRDKRRKQG